MNAAAYAENYADYAIAVDDHDDRVDEQMTWGAVWQYVFDAYEAGFDKARELAREQLR